MNNSCLTPQDRVAIGWALERIAFVKDTTQGRLTEMKASDPSPDSGAIEVGSAKRSPQEEGSDG